MVRTLARFATSVVAAASLLVAAPSAADATVVRAMSLFEKARAAPLVVHGVVERVETEWDVPEAKTRTLITVQVLEGLKGTRRGERITVAQGGGTLGSFSQTIPGTSAFEPGEEVILFLEAFGAYAVEVGIGIGKYGVDTNGRDKWVTHNPDVAVAVEGDRDRPMRITASTPMTPEPLDGFLKRVRSYIAGFTVPTGAARKAGGLRPALTSPR